MHLFEFDCPQNRKKRGVEKFAINIYFHSVLSVDGVETKCECDRNVQLWQLKPLDILFSSFAWNRRRPTDEVCEKKTNESRRKILFKLYKLLESCTCMHQKCCRINGMVWVFCSSCSSLGHCCCEYVCIVAPALLRMLFFVFVSFLFSLHLFPFFTLFGHHFFFFRIFSRISLIPRLICTTQMLCNSHEIRAVKFVGYRDNSSNNWTWYIVHTKRLFSQGSCAQ